MATIKDVARMAGVAPSTISKYMNGGHVRKENAEAITLALMRATGEKLRPALYTDGASPAVEEGAEPVDSFISKLNKHQIDFFIEE